MAQPGSDADLPEPPQVRRLRLLVSLLMLVMIGGMLVVVAVMVVRLGAVGGAPVPPAPVTAERLVLPAGAEVVALGQGSGGVMVLTRDATGAETLRVLDPGTGTELSATPVARE